MDIIKQLESLTYNKKEKYLIDVRGYDQTDFDGIGEIGLDNIIIDNNFIIECLEYNI